MIKVYMSLVKKKSDNMKRYEEEGKKIQRRNSYSHLSEIMIIYVLVNVLPNFFFPVQINRHILK